MISLTQYGQEVALEEYRGRQLTYMDLSLAISSRVADWQAQGVPTGSHIALVASSGIDWVIEFLAMIAGGYIPVCISPRLPQSQIDRLLRHCDAVRVVRDVDFGRRLPSVFQPCSWVHRQMDDPLMICYTSGSMGDPKGVVLSYRNVRHNIQNALDNLPQGEHQTLVSILPPDHMYGLIGEVLSQLECGNRVVFLGTKPVSEILMAAYQCYHPYAIVAVPVIVEQIYRALGERMKAFFTPWLKQLLVGGGALDKRVEQALIDMSIPITVGYGMTETGPLIGASLWSDYKPFSVGKVVQGMQVKSVDGELWVKGENVMLGYYKNPELTAEVLTPDGWFKTGDMGFVDKDGNIYLEGHKDSRIVCSNGYTVYPENIEQVLNVTLPINESCVVVRNGQLVALVYAQQPIDAEWALKEVNAQLPHYCLLQAVLFVDAPFEKTSKFTIKRYLYQS